MARKSSAPTEGAPRFASLTEDDIGAQTDSGSFSRGRTYFRQGRIRETVLRGAMIEALCQGSDVEPYRVRATLARLGESDENPRAFSCTCPRGGFCKHIVALLLTWIDDPALFTTRPPLADLLRERSHDELVALIERIIQRHPELERLVELPLPQAGSGNQPANVQTVDAAMIRRQAHAAFTSVDPWEWRAASGVTSDLHPLLELGQGYLDAGRWADAQAVFTALADEGREWLLSFSDEEGEIAVIMITCDEGLAACLDAQAELPEGERLSGDARMRLIGTLYDIWHADIFEIGGIDLSQHGPEAIARNATDAERAMVEEWLRDERADGWSQRALTGFLVLLREHAGLDDEELLTIYREAELWDEVALMLLRLDRVGEAEAIAGRNLTDPYALIGFANALIERGGEHIGRALVIVDDRLWELEGKNPVADAVLQQWLVDQFSLHDRPHDALAMAERRFRRQPSLQTVHAVRDAAGLPGQEPDAWSEARPRLERHLREKEAWTVLVDVFLEDGDVRAALDAYARQRTQGRQGLWYAPTWSYDDQPLRLAQAAAREFPDDAVAIYRQLADQMIAYRDRAQYRVAAGYLARAKETLARHGRADHWQALISEVRDTHKTLRALREELDALDLR